MIQLNPSESLKQQVKDRLDGHRLLKDLRSINTKTIALVVVEVAAIALSPLFIAAALEHTEVAQPSLHSERN